MANLKIRFGSEVLGVCELEHEVFSIGREANCDLAIENLGVSNKHATISHIAGSDAFLLEDLASANGTFVNGKRVDRLYLNHNDEILIGKHVLVFKNKGDAKKGPKVVPRGGGKQTYMMDVSEVKKVVARMKGGEPTAVAAPEPKNEPIYTAGPWKVLFFLSLLANVLLGGALAVLSSTSLRDRLLEILP